MTTFGNPHEEYASTSIKTNKQRKADEATKKQATNAKDRSNGRSQERRDENENRRGGGKIHTAFNQGGGYQISGITQIICLISAIGQLVVAFIHIINILDNMNFCAELDTDFAKTECVGDSLTWKRSTTNPLTDETIVAPEVLSSALNASWRTGMFLIRY